MATVTLNPGEKLVIEFADTDGQFEVHFDTPEYKNQLVIKETAGLIEGEDEAMLYMDTFVPQDSLFDVEFVEKAIDEFVIRNNETKLFWSGKRNDWCSYEAADSFSIDTAEELCDKIYEQCELDVEVFSVASVTAEQKFRVPA